MKKNKHIGSSIDDLMKEEGWYEEAEEQAIKEVIAWQLHRPWKKSTSPNPQWQHGSRSAGRR